MPATLTADSLAEAAQSLSSSELDMLVQKLSSLRAHRRAPSLSESEADLLKRIENAVPLAALQRRKALTTAQQQRSWTSEEYAEFATLTDEIEQAEAGRIELLSELAALRRVPLLEIARQLGFGRS
jgi:hypothetical protein